MESRKLGPFALPLLLLVLSVLINYIDRGNLSIAAPLLKDELGLSASQLGILFSAFFWTYTVMLFVCGWFIDRFDVNRVLALGFLLWSLATAATGIVHGFAMLLAMRLVLGIGESVAFPCYCKILARHLPEHRRGFANGAIIAGMKCGPVAGNPWRRSPHRKVWVASSVHRNWTPQPRLATCLDEGHAPRCNLSSSRSLPACDRRLTAALILGHCRRRLLSRLSALFHDHLASLLPRSRTASLNE